MISFQLADKKNADRKQSPLRHDVAYASHMLMHQTPLITILVFLLILIFITNFGKNKYRHSHTDSQERVLTYVQSGVAEDITQVTRRRSCCVSTTQKLGRNPVSKHQIQPEYGDEQADAGRDYRIRLARPNSQARTQTEKY